MTMDFRSVVIPGCYEIVPPVHSDRRGYFVKPFVMESFAIRGLEHDFAEQYYSSSRAQVTRGMHFQIPPHDHAKLVYCVHGTVLDVILDLRRGSPTFGQHTSVTLSANIGNAIFLPRGLAHGFCVLESPAILVYNVTSAYCAAADAGIRWDSFGMQWPWRDPIISARDAAFPPLEQFDTPFQYDDSMTSAA